jgi:hypothetical protein
MSAMIRAFSRFKRFRKMFSSTPPPWVGVTQVEVPICRPLRPQSPHTHPSVSSWGRQPVPLRVPALTHINLLSRENKRVRRGNLHGKFMESSVRSAQSAEKQARAQVARNSPTQRSVDSTLRPVCPLSEQELN